MDSPKFLLLLTTLWLSVCVVAHHHHVTGAFYLTIIFPFPRMSQSVSLIVGALVGCQGNSLSPPYPLRVIVLFDNRFCTSAWRLTRSAATGLFWRRPRSSAVPSQFTSPWREVNWHVKCKVANKYDCVAWFLCKVCGGAIHVKCKICSRNFCQRLGHSA